MHEQLERLTELFSLAQGLSHGSSQLLELLDQVELRTLLSPLIFQDLLEMNFLGEGICQYIRAINIMEMKLLAIHNVFVVTIFNAR